MLSCSMATKFAIRSVKAECLKEEAPAVGTEVFANHPFGPTWIAFHAVNDGVTGCEQILRSVRQLTVPDAEWFTVTIEAAKVEPDCPNEHAPGDVAGNGQIVEEIFVVIDSARSKATQRFGGDGVSAAETALADLIAVSAGPGKKLPELTITARPGCAQVPVRFAPQTKWPRKSPHARGVIGIAGLRAVGVIMGTEKADSRFRAYALAKLAAEWSNDQAIRIDLEDAIDIQILQDPTMTFGEAKGESTAEAPAMIGAWVIE